MKKHTYLPLVTAIFGLLGLGLRSWLFSLTDSRNLLPVWHISSVLLGVLTAGFLIFLFLAVRPLHVIRKHSQLFPAGLPGAVGCAAAAAGVLVHCLSQFIASRELFAMICLPAGILTAAAMGYTAVSRAKGRPVQMLPYFALTAYLILHAFSQCQQWGSESQLLYYLQPLLACVLLLLTAYQQTALLVQKSSRRWFVFFRMSALFFCCVSICSQSPLFYLAMTLWTGLDQCNLQTNREGA